MTRQAGAECIVVACPLCQVNLDLRQADASKAHGELPRTPVLYITQLLGLALGLSHKELGINALSVSADALLAGRNVETAAVAGGQTSLQRTSKPPQYQPMMMEMVMAILANLLAP